MNLYKDFPYVCKVSPDSKIRREQFEWCKKYIGIGTNYTHKTKHLIVWWKSGQDDSMNIHFKHEKDAMLFILRWT